MQKIFNHISPSIGMNIFANENYEFLSNELPKGAKILVIGGSIIGEGMDRLYDDNKFEIIGSDVSFGPETKLFLTHMISHLKIILLIVLFYKQF